MNEPTPENAVDDPIDPTELESYYRPSYPQWLVYHVVPAFLIAIFLLLATGGIIKKLKHEPPVVEREKVLPVVEVLPVSTEPITIEIESQGTVQARTETQLIAEVSGRIVSISPALYAGGFFQKGDVLAEIESIDYEAALAAARSRLADARLAFEQETAAAEQAVEDWKVVGNGDTPSPLVLRQPQLERAQANLDAATASVSIAERDLKRTKITAPYAGRVRQKSIDIGQFVAARQSQVAHIYATDAAEVRLDLPLSDTRFLDLPEAYQENLTNAPKPPVELSANYGGKRYTWQGTIDRSEGAIDPQTRLLTVVARIENPYSASSENPPLKMGTFVTARIKGSTIPNGVRLPRKALRENDVVYVIDSENQLQIRQVSVSQRLVNEVIIGDGLTDGDRVCLTPLQFAVEGMQVEIDQSATEETE